ncbi:lipopolysaccharide biosynthesis protein [Stutzerimonas stutzeri]|uniref:lipopolysaccharide biosynthesis protein n=1 Tax=Stutzerimonas stutzeri TaxID=316 RepID=UPI0030130300
MEYLQNPLLILVTTPIFLEMLGAKYFGLWALFLAAVSIGGYFSAGITQALTKTVAATHAEQYGASYKKISSGASLLVAANVGVLLVLIAIYFNVASKEDGFSEETWAWFFIALVLSVIFDQLDSIGVGFLRGLERFSLAAKFETLARIFQYALCSALLIAGYGIDALFLAVSVFSFLRFSIRYFLLNKEVAKISLWPSLHNARSLAPLALWGFIQGVGYLLYNVFDRFIIAEQLSYELLTAYSVSAQLTTQIHAVVSAGISVLFPMVSRLNASGDISRISRRLFQIFLIISIMAGAATAILCIWGDLILWLWLDPQTSIEAAPILSLLAISSFLQSLSIVPMFVLLGLGKAKKIAIVNICAGVLSFIIMSTFVSVLDVYGVLLGKFFYGLVLLYLNYLCAKELGWIRSCP